MLRKYIAYSLLPGTMCMVVFALGIVENVLQAEKLMLLVS